MFASPFRMSPFPPHGPTLGAITSPCLQMGKLRHTQSCLQAQGSAPAISPASQSPAWGRKEGGRAGQICHVSSLEGEFLIAFTNYHSSNFHNCLKERVFIQLNVSRNSLRKKLKIYQEPKAKEIICTGHRECLGLPLSYTHSTPHTL